VAFPGNFKSPSMMCTRRPKWLHKASCWTWLRQAPRAVPWTRAVWGPCRQLIAWPWR